MLRTTATVVAVCENCKTEKYVEEGRTIPKGWLRTSCPQYATVSLLDDGGRKVLAITEDLTFCSYQCFMGWLDAQIKEHDDFLGVTK